MSTLEPTTANAPVAASVSGDGDRDSALAEAWEAYSRWDAAAIARKRRLDLSRRVIFVLLVAAALTGVLASQLTLTWFAGIAAACSAAAALLGREAVGPAVERLWLTARAAAETLKSEAFKYAAGASPYDSDDGGQRLLHGTHRSLPSGQQYRIGLINSCYVFAASGRIRGQDNQGDHQPNSL